MKVNLVNLRHIEELEKNWNDNNADPIPKEVIELTRSLIKLLDGTRPEMFPTANDSIQIEWENDDMYLELEVQKDDRIKLFHLKNKGEKNDKQL